MNNKAKKLLIIFAVVVFVIAIGVGVYVGIGRSRTALTPKTATSGSTGLPTNSPTTPFTPGIGSTATTSDSVGELSGTLSLLTSVTAQDFWAWSDSSSTAHIFFINEKGTIGLVDANTKGDEVASLKDKPLRRAIANIDGSFSAIQTQAGDWELFNSSSRVWSDIDTNLSSVAFSPSGKRLGYLKNEDDDKIGIYWLDVSVSPRKLTLVSTISAHDMFLQWADENTMLLVSRPSASAHGQVWAFDVKNGTVSSIASGSGLMAKFGAFGVGVISTSDGNNKSSWFIDSSGATISSLPFYTLPQKCAFQKLQIWCAQPSWFSDQTPILPDNYLRGDLYSSDILYRIDTNGISVITLPTQAPIDIAKIVAVENSLVFLNRIDSRIYEFDVATTTKQ